MSLVETAAVSLDAAFSTCDLVLLDGIVHAHPGRCPQPDFGYFGKCKLPMLATRGYSYSHVNKKAGTALWCLVQASTVV